MHTCYGTNETGVYICSRTNPPARYIRIPLPKCGDMFRQCRCSRRADHVLQGLVCVGARGQPFRLSFFCGQVAMLASVVATFGHVDVAHVVEAHHPHSLKQQQKINDWWSSVISRGETNALSESLATPHITVIKILRIRAHEKKQRHQNSWVYITLITCISESSHPSQY